MNKFSGFTLVELLIVILIAGILAIVAVPSYTSAVLSSHRTDAITGLLDAALREGRYFTINNKYDSSMTGLGYAADPSPVPSSTNTTYNLCVQSTTAATSTATAGYLLMAVPNGNQANDDCGTFTYTDLGTRGLATGASCSTQAQGTVVTDTALLARCWRQ